MDRLILPLFGALFLLLIGAAGVWGYDRHPPIGWRYHTHVLWKKIDIGFDLPDSLQTERDKAVADSLALQTAIAAQNASLRGMEAERDAEAAQLTKALQAARKPVAMANRRATVIAAFKPVGSDVCAQLLSVDAEVVRGRR